MPPTVYSDTTLQAYMHATLGATAGVLGWDIGHRAYDQALHEALRGAGISSSSAAVNVAVLEAYARRAVWQVVVNETAGDYNYTAANGTERREAIWEHAQQMLAQCERHLGLLVGTSAVRGPRSAAVRNEPTW